MNSLSDFSEDEYITSEEAIGDLLLIGIYGDEEQDYDETSKCLSEEMRKIQKIYNHIGTLHSENG